MRPIHEKPTSHCLHGFRRFLRHCALDESSLSTESVKHYSQVIVIVIVIVIVMVMVIVIVIVIDDMGNS